MKQLVSVSVLKNTLLDIVRQVEKGETFEITKAGKLVARLSPATNPDDPPMLGFGKGSFKIVGDIVAPIDDEWTFDAENVVPKLAKKKKRK
jgi:prevent-host-death family protein